MGLQQLARNGRAAKRHRSMDRVALFRHAYEWFLGRLCFIRHSHYGVECLQACCRTHCLLLIHFRISLEARHEISFLFCRFGMMEDKQTKTATEGLEKLTLAKYNRFIGYHMSCNIKAGSK